eukprot:Lithocolla_globosa_v1_NODE_3965_length_1542_cov_3.302623.p1 type:complete len:200 gc:universal NODE_3965_length_1542_cov_3.302623:958-359(-)
MRKVVEFFHKSGIGQEFFLETIELLAADDNALSVESGLPSDAKQRWQSLVKMWTRFMQKWEPIEKVYSELQKPFDLIRQIYLEFLALAAPITTLIRVFQDRSRAAKMILNLEMAILKTGTLDVSQPLEWHDPDVLPSNDVYIVSFPHEQCDIVKDTRLRVIQGGDEIFQAISNKKGQVICRVHLLCIVSSNGDVGTLMS